LLESSVRLSPIISVFGVFNEERLGAGVAGNGTGRAKLASLVILLDEDAGVNDGISP
jgi:hypothetical protein